MATQSPHEPDLTLLQHLIADQQHSAGTGDLTLLLHAIEVASKFVSSKVRAAGLLNLYGLQGNTNVQGEEVKKLDVIANDAFISALGRSCRVAMMVSEENAEPIVVAAPHGKGKYAAVFDPLDGSSNIDCNVSIGSIFGIYRRKDADAAGSLDDVLRPGSELVAAGYTMYGTATTLVLSSGGPVNCFTLDPSSGEFVLTHSNIQMPKRGKIYSINEGNSQFWNAPTKAYVDKVKMQAKPYSHRYVGSMVADVHRTLLYGGIFMYPADANSRDGKLRLLYEANPMSFLIEHAGGAATTGTQRILDLQPTDIHQRVPVYLGSIEDVHELEALYKAAAAK